MDRQPDLNRFITPEQAAALAKNKGTLKEILRSPDAKRLMELLRRQSGGSVKDAAARGDAKGLEQMVKKLMETPDGAALVQKLNQSFRK